MEAFIIFLLITFAVILALSPIALAKAIRAQREIEKLKQRLRELETREHPGAMREGVAADEMVEIPVVPIATPPPLPSTPASPVIASKAARPIPPPPPPSLPHKPINWEQFMGAKMFAWVGGLALFLGVGFFVKYSFEHNLIPPELRAAIGFLFGLALVIGGVALKRKENVVTAQTLCATGILILYTVTFACRAFYHFPFFGLLPTFALMTLITAAAFVLAVRMNAIVVAVLGIGGGFLTPILLSSGQDNPAALFGYIALLDIGLLFVAQRKEWVSLPVLGAVGTVLMQIAWVGDFFLRNQYFAGNRTLVPMAIFLALQALFCVAAFTGKTSFFGGRNQRFRRNDAAESRVKIRAPEFELSLSSAALGIAVFDLGWAFYFLSFSRIAERPTVLFSHLLLVDAGLLALVLATRQLTRFLTLTGSAAFLFLALWTHEHLTTQNLYVALAAYFVFALLHSSAPLVVQRLGRPAPAWAAQFFPAATLLLVLLPILKLATASFLVWPLVLCIDVLALMAAIATGTLAAMIVILVLTLAALGIWLLQVPAPLNGLDSSLFLIGGFAIFFVAAATWASRRINQTAIASSRARLFGSLRDPANLAIQLPALSASLPFVLLIMAALRLPLTNPNPIFTLALLLVVLLLGLTKIFSLDLLACIALGSAVLLEAGWHLAHFQPANATIPLIWYIGFAAIFTVFPFLFRRQFANKRLVWASSAFSAPFHFFLVYDLVRATHPQAMLGLVPATFALPALLCLVAILKSTPSEKAARTAQLALFGGAALFFITLIFPIQFDRQWITLGWALEGVALCWLFGRVPHPGLRLAGVALVVIAFARLTLNPAVLSYHARAAAPIFNWYLYTYGVAALCACVVAHLLTSSPRYRLFDIDTSSLLYALGIILLFLLLNIEIADYFSKPGTAALTFQFSGDFARDMSYSIAWAMFALGLLIIGLRKRAAAVRYAGLALLALVILKLFAHDLSQLDQLYRIAAFIVVAAIAIIASFLYQRFLGTTETQPSS